MKHTIKDESICLQYMIESDPKLALFIMDLRSKPHAYVEEMVLKHRKDLARHQKNRGQRAYDFYYRHFFLVAYGFCVNGDDFIAAAASPELRVKRLGYLGASFVEFRKHSASMMDIIKEDLKKDDFNGYALAFLGIADVKCGDQRVTSSIRYAMNMEEQRTRAHIVYHKITDSLSGMSLIEKNERTFFSKIQIVIDRLRMTQDENDFAYLRNEREITYITTFFRRTDKYYVRTKCLQLFKIMVQQNISLEQSLLRFIDESVNLIRLLKKSLGEIAYYVEAVDFLLLVGYETHKTGTFIFKMLESKSDIFIGVAARMALKYSVYTDIALDRCLEMLGNEDVLDVLAGLIDKNNYGKIYSRKEEIILMLEGKDCSDEMIRKAITVVLRRVFEFASSRMAMEIYLNEPLFCIEEPVEKFLIPEDRLKVFNELKDKSDPNQFCLLYQTIDLKAVTFSHLREMLVRHLAILMDCITSKSVQHHITYTMAYLLSILQSLNGCEATRDRLIMMFCEVEKRSKDERLRNVLLQSIMHHNAISDEKVAYLGRCVFLRYVVHESYGKKRLSLKCNYPVLHLAAYNRNTPLYQLSCTTDALHVVKTYELAGSKNVKVCAEFDGIYCESFLF